MFPTQGIQYPQVCGRIIGYQKGQPGAFIGTESAIINNRYADGVSLTYGNPRRHIWTFANALNEYQHYYRHKCPCTNVNEQCPINIYLFLLVMIISVRLVYHQVNNGAVVSSMLMIPWGMVKVVVQLAHAAHSTIRHGSVNNYLYQLMLIWKPDVAHVIAHILKTRQYN